jgi:hypothetical protein
MNVATKKSAQLPREFRRIRLELARGRAIPPAAAVMAMN